MFAAIPRSARWHPRNMKPNNNILLLLLRPRVSTSRLTRRPPLTLFRLQTQVNTQQSHHECSSSSLRVFRHLLMLAPWLRSQRRLQLSLMRMATRSPPRTSLASTGGSSWRARIPVPFARDADGRIALLKLLSGCLVTAATLHKTLRENRRVRCLLRQRQQTTHCLRARERQDLRRCRCQCRLLHRGLT